MNALPVQQTPVQQSPQTLNQKTPKTQIETSSELPKTPDKKPDSPKTKSLDSSDEFCYLRIPKTELDKPEIKKLLEDSTKDTNTEMQNSDKKSTMDEQEKSGQPNVLIQPPSTNGSVSDLNFLVIRGFKANYGSYDWSTHSITTSANTISSCCTSCIPASAISVTIVYSSHCS